MKLTIILDEANAAELYEAARACSKAEEKPVSPREFATESILCTLAARRQLRINAAMKRKHKAQFATRPERAVRVLQDRSQFEPVSVNA